MTDHNLYANDSKNSGQNTAVLAQFLQKATKAAVYAAFLILLSSLILGAASTAAQRPLQAPSGRVVRPPTPSLSEDGSWPVDIRYTVADGWFAMTPSAAQPVSLTEIAIVGTQTPLHCNTYPTLSFTRVSDGAAVAAPVILPAGLSAEHPLVLNTFSGLQVGDAVRITVVHRGYVCVPEVNQAIVSWQMQGL